MKKVAKQKYAGQAKNQAKPRYNKAKTANTPASSFAQTKSNDQASAHATEHAILASNDEKDDEIGSDLEEDQLNLFSLWH